MAYSSNTRTVVNLHMVVSEMVEDASTQLLMSRRSLIRSSMHRDKLTYHT